MYLFICNIYVIYTHTHTPMNIMLIPCLNIGPLMELAGFVIKQKSNNYNIRMFVVFVTL